MASERPEPEVRGRAGAGPRPEGRRVAASSLRSLEESVAGLFTQMPSWSSSPTHRPRYSGADKTRVWAISWRFSSGYAEADRHGGFFASHLLECDQ